MSVVMNNIFGNLGSSKLGCRNKLESFFFEHPVPVRKMLFGIFSEGVIQVVVKK